MNLQPYDPFERVQRWWPILVTLFLLALIAKECFR